MRRVAILKKAIKDDDGKVTTPESVLVKSYDELDDSLDREDVLDNHRKEVGELSRKELKVVFIGPFGVMQ